MFAPLASGQASEKDRALDGLAETVNIAQFVSFAPRHPLVQRFSHIRAFRPNHRFTSPEEAIETLLASSPEGAVNIRTFTPESPKGGPLTYRLTQTGEVVAALGQLAQRGLYTIVNETINVRDGGVSGVALGDVLEFAPDNTPRCVESGGTVAIERCRGLRILETVYHFRPALDFPPQVRVEFSIHPKPRGVRHEHTTIWELEFQPSLSPSPRTNWPNQFSRLIGDKAFGLLIADAYELPVPATTVISRRIAPFSFGRSTGTSEVWFRTCPSEQIPGRLKTTRGWIDPFQIVHEEDPKGSVISSVIAQQAVRPRFSGDAALGADGTLIIEGTAGQGDLYMQGKKGPSSLPTQVKDAVSGLYSTSAALLGAVRFEWVYDGAEAWIVQLHRGAIQSHGRVICPGKATREQYFDANIGLEALRGMIPELKEKGEGLVIRGDIGVLSHMGDLLRKAEIPSRIESAMPLPPKQTRLAFDTD